MTSEEPKNTGAEWWRQMLTRRQANGILVALGLAATISTVGCGEDEEDLPEEQHDALDLQKSKGWNVGSDDQQLAIQNRATTDSEKSTNWASFNDPKALLAAYTPKNSAWQPFVVPTLVQSMAQPTLKSQIAPVHSTSMDEAYSRGLGMREILMKSKNPENTLLVVDLPGPEAVAFGAALADVADPIMTFDNWPHPLGVVPSQQTLGSLLYYASEVQAKSAKRPANAPGVLILDNTRLNPYTDDSDKFDNRYLAKVPTADKLQSMNVTNVMYAVPSESQSSELDDINEDFVAYKEKGINVTMLPLSNFQPSTEAVDTTKSSGSSHTYHRTYYYGGGPSLLPWFFLTYAMYSPGYAGYRAPIGARPSSIRTSSYAPVRRPTMFASRTTGGRTGVGKTKPSGFGRVSTRTTSSGRTIVGSSGRSGSYGRSGGRSGS